MLLRPILIELAEKYNGEYDIKSFSNEDEGYYITIYYLKLTFLDTQIDFKYEFGQSNLAEIRFTFKNINPIVSSDKKAFFYLLRVYFWLIIN